VTLWGCFVETQCAEAVGKVCAPGLHLHQDITRLLQHRHRLVYETHRPHVPLLDNPSRNNMTEVSGPTGSVLTAWSCCSTC
jgi:hypothetical protein